MSGALRWRHGKRTSSEERAHVFAQNADSHSLLKHFKVFSRFCRPAAAITPNTGHNTTYTGQITYTTRCMTVSVDLLRQIAGSIWQPDRSRCVHVCVRLRFHFFFFFFACWKPATSCLSCKSGVEQNYSSLYVSCAALHVTLPLSLCAYKGGFEGLLKANTGGFFNCCRVHHSIPHSPFELLFHSVFTSFHNNPAHSFQSWFCSPFIETYLFPGSLLPDHVICLSIPCDIFLFWFSIIKAVTSRSPRGHERWVPECNPISVRPFVGWRLRGRRLPLCLTRTTIAQAVRDFLEPF